jgi:hypothetical protein
MKNCLNKQILPSKIVMGKGQVPSLKEHLRFWQSFKGNIFQKKGAAPPLTISTP